MFRCVIFLAVICAAAGLASAQSTRITALTQWEFAEQGSKSFLPAVVPGTVHTDLFANGKIPSPYHSDNEKNLQWIGEKNWVYRTMIRRSPDGGNLELNFLGLDTYAEVFIGNKKVLTADNMYRQWRLAIDSLVQDSAELKVVFTSPLKKLETLAKAGKISGTAGNDAALVKVSPYVRKAPYHFGWDWGPRYVTCGIWRPVEVIETPLAHIRFAEVKQKFFSKQSATLEAVAEIQTTIPDFSGILTVMVDGKELGKKEFRVLRGQHEIKVPVILPGPKLWQPNGSGESHLYKVRFLLHQANEFTDAYSTEFGLRKVELAQEKAGLSESFYFRINGEPVFMKGANYIPQDIFLPSVSPARYRELLTAAHEAHFNMVRVWGGGIYENELFYDLCDSLGILVWQDFMFACSMYPGDKVFLDNVRTEAAENIRRLRHHPCIALWCGNNEVDVAWFNWGWQNQFGIHGADSTAMRKDYETLFQNVLPGVLKEMDPDRPYIHTSPLSNWGKPELFDRGDNHYWGVWHGEEPFENFRNNVPRFMSEYGFQSFTSASLMRSHGADFALPDSTLEAWHQKSYKGSRMMRKYATEWFGPSKDFENLIYKSQLAQAEAYRIAIESQRTGKPHCMGTLYWQLNDCWPGPSWSSIHYDGTWKPLHYMVKRMYEPLIAGAYTDNGEIKAWIVSDLNEVINGTLHLRLRDFGGKVLKSDSLFFSLRRQQAGIPWRQRVSDYLKGFDSLAVYLDVQFATETDTVQNTCFFAKPSALKLPADPGLRVEFSDPETTPSYVILTSDSLAVGVNLQFEKRPLDKNDNYIHLSDNYFSLTPGEKKRIYIRDKDPQGKYNRLALEVTHLKSE